ncbi:MAG: DNA-directed RNA polymerase subunit omega [bacterium]|nr:DNA-directed RNA polymerase subunit omega [bacterium]
MARITVEDCLHRVEGGNRFALIHLVVERIRQHRKGEPYLVEGKNKEVVMTLREVAAGKVSLENIHELGQKPKKEKKSSAAAEAKNSDPAPAAEM